jgi:hypothetical protein
MRRIKNYQIAIVAVVLAAILTAFSVNAALQCSISLPSTGQISTKIYAISGSAADIQTAVNQANAQGGGSVVIPSGTWYWNGETVSVPGGVNVMGASNAGCQGHEANWQDYVATTILHNNKAKPVASMFYLDGSNGKPTRISGIQFELSAPIGNDSDGGSAVITSYKPKDNRFDHCTFINAYTQAILITNTNDGFARALIDHCRINNVYKTGSGSWLWGYGFYVQGHINNWNINSDPNHTWDTNVANFAGKYDTMPNNCPVMYVEDCHFSYCRHATDGIQYGWQVTRYCLIDHPYPVNYYMLQVHGTAENGYLSARGSEVYNNTIIGATGINAYNTVAIGGRGGSFIVFNNTFLNDYNSNNNVFFTIDDNEDEAHTIPQSHINSTYIWSNTITNATLLASTNPTYFLENVSYFLRAPTLTQDDFTYTPYTYPHPLTQNSTP